MEYENIKLAGRRSELLEHLKDLSDRDYQKSIWVDQVNEYRKDGTPPKVFDNFDEKVHFFFDDTLLFDNPREEIGNLLYDSCELQAVAAVVAAIDVVLTRGGKYLSDEQYIQLAEWDDVVSSSSDALNVLASRETR